MKGNKLSLKHIKDVCKPGKGEQSCRYLCGGSEGFYCATDSTITPDAKIIDERIEKGIIKNRPINCDGRNGIVYSNRNEQKKVFGL